MTDEKPVEAEETKDPVEGGETPEEKPSSGRTFTEAEMRAEAEALASKRTEEWERKTKRLQKEFDSFRQARETEDEKAERERREREDARGKELAATHERRGELIGALIAKGKSIDQAKKLADYAQTLEWSDTDDAIKKLSSELGVTFESPATPGGGGGNSPEAEESSYEPEAVEKRISEPGGMEWFRKNRDKIKAFQDAKYGGGIRQL